MSIEQLNYYRVTCDGTTLKDFGGSEPCKLYINVAARDYAHAVEVLDVNKWLGKVICHGQVFDSCPGLNALCPKHKDG